MEYSGASTVQRYIAISLGEDVIFHHKTGSLDCVEHDAGIIETMNGDFCFVLLMSHLCNDKAKQLGAQMGLIMKEFVEDALP